MLDLKPPIRERLDFVLKSLVRTREVMDAEGFSKKSLIGFCGGPWTLMAYMVEGGPSSEWPNAKKWLYAWPEAATGLLKALSEACVEYLCAQADAGAQALQVFDSHAGAIPPREYLELCWPHMAFIAQEVRHRRPSCTLIGFAKGNRKVLKYLNESAFDVVGVDFSMDPAEARTLVPSKCLMGNLDPAALHGDAESIAERVHYALDGLAPVGRGVIANLGHGVGVSTPTEGVGYYVQAVRSWQARERMVIGSRTSKLAMVQTHAVQV